MERRVKEQRARIYLVVIGVVAAGAITIIGATLISESILDRLALFATAVGPLVILGSAYFVVRQVHEAATAVRGQLFDTTAGRMLDLSRLFVEHPELRPYFYDGVDIEKQAEEIRQRVLAIA
jgi:hypothetical protein